MNVKVVAMIVAAVAVPHVARAQNRDTIIAATKELMAQVRYCDFITVDSAGFPHARIVDPILPDSAMTVWIGTNPLTRKVSEIARNQRVSLLCSAGQAGYVTMLGTAQVMRDSATKAHHWKPEWAQFYKNENRGDDYVLIKFQPMRIEIVDFAHGLINDPKTWRPVTIELKKLKH